MTWKLADAKNRFSEVVNLALTEGPQHITRRGDEVVLLSKAEYERMAAGGTPEKKDFLKLLRSAPKLTEEEQALFERNKSLSRPVDPDELFGRDEA